MAFLLGVYTPHTNFYISCVLNYKQVRNVLIFFLYPYVLTAVGDPLWICQKQF